MRNSTSWVRWVLAAIVFLGLCLTSWQIVRQTNSTLPSHEFSRLRAATLTFGQLDRVRSQDKEPVSAFCGQTNTVGVLTRPGVPDLLETVTVAMTDDAYPQLHSLTLVRGQFFSKAWVGANDSVAVISSDLAVKLFMTLDVIGQRVEINGTPATVIGVYQSVGSLLRSMASDGRDVVFVPHYTGPRNADMAVDLVYLQPRADAEITYYGAKTRLNESLDGALLADYAETDYAVTKTMMTQGLRFLLFFIGLVLFVDVARLLFQAVHDCIVLIREGRQWGRRYDGPALRKAGARALALLAAAVALVVLCTFSPTFPTGFFPSSGQLFDLSHYIGLICSSFHAHNAATLYRFYDNLALVSGWCLALSAIFTFLAFLWLRASLYRWIRHLRATEGR